MIENHDIECNYHLSTVVQNNPLFYNVLKRDNIKFLSKHFMAVLMISDSWLINHNMRA